MAALGRAKHLSFAARRTADIRHEGEVSSAICLKRQSNNDNDGDNGDDDGSVSTLVIESCLTIKFFLKNKKIWKKREVFLLPGKFPHWVLFCF